MFREFPRYQCPFHSDPQTWLSANWLGFLPCFSDARSQVVGWTDGRYVLVQR